MVKDHCRVVQNGSKNNRQQQELLISLKPIHKHWSVRTTFYLINNINEMVKFLIK
jgi:hypothetical protein